MIETTIRNPEKHETLTADSQGRVNLGVEYAARDVELVVVESTVREPERTGLQQTIADEPMTAAERKGMLFVRAFGVSPRFLKDEHDAVVEDGRVDPESVAPTDVDWSHGFLQDPKNVARFKFDGEAAPEAQFPFEERLTEEPTAVETDEGGDQPVYRYENDHGDVSGVAQSLVENVERMFGYDPAEELANVRVNPEEAPNPVLFRDPGSDVFVAVAPRVAE